MADPNEQKEILSLIDAAIEESKRTRALLNNLAPAILDILEPTLGKIVDNTRMNKEDITRAISDIKFNLPNITLPEAKELPAPIINIPAPIVNLPEPKVTVNVPEIKLPTINVPEPKVTVNIPQIKVPDVHVEAPIINFPDSMKLAGVDSRHPLPVILTDDKGNPYIAGAFGVGSRGPTVIRDILTQQGRSVMDETNNAIRVNLAVGSISLSSADGAILDGTNSTRARVWALTDSNALGVAIVDANGDQISSFGGGTQYVQGTAQSTFTGNIFLWEDSDQKAQPVTSANPLPVSGSFSASLSAAIGQGDGSAALRIIQAGDSVSSTIINSGTLTGINNSLAVTFIDSSGIGFSGSNPVPVTLVSGAGSTTATNIVDSSGVAYSGSNPVPISGIVAQGVNAGLGSAWAVKMTDGASSLLPVGNGETGNSLRVILAQDTAYSTATSQVGTWNIGTVTTVTGVTNSLAATLIDSSGVQYSGSNPLPIFGTVTISNPVTSTISVGPTVAGVADDGSAPIKVGKIARLTNPTALSDGQIVSSSADKLGRTLTRPMQIRELISTAYVSISTGSETTLISGVAGSFLDCIWMGFANQSSAAVQVDVRAVSAGNIVNTVYIPAQSTAGWAPPIPWPQDATGNNWTVDMPDITGTTVNIQALFTKEL